MIFRKDYLKELKKRIEIERKPEDAAKEDEFLAQITNLPGWEILKERIEGRIFVLMQPGDNTNDLAMKGAISMARELAIDVLQGVLSDVEAPAMKGKSEPEAE